MAYEDIISRLTLEEKCALLQGASSFGTFAISGLGVPELQFSDGSHGMRHQYPEDANHLGAGRSMPATCFPTAATVAQSWDPQLSERVGAAIGEEAACQGVGCVLGPALNIKRSPLTGRNFEYFSEDPLLSGKMAAAYVRGIQSQGVAACPKHFAANSQETRRQTSDSVMDERTLRELYLDGFETVVREGDPWCLMTSYNLVNGIYANESTHLLSDILRGEWGYGGAVVTDWGGSHDHVAGVAAGSTFEMPRPGLGEVRALAAAVRSGKLSQEVLDERVGEALHLVLRTRAAVEAAQGREFDKTAHHQLAREAAAQSIVLLKNDTAVARGSLPAGRPLLPLAPGTKVALLGDFAFEPRYQGAGSSLVNATRVDALAELIERENVQVVAVERGFVRGQALDASRVRRALDAAREAEVVVVCLGLEETAESEGIDRSNMRIPTAQVSLLNAVVTENPNTVVLLSAGASVETAWAHDARALLHLALGGQAGAGAALDVLMGRVNPSGKCAETWYDRLADSPTAHSFPSRGSRAEYREGLYVGYRYCQTAGVRPAYPFGFGLSYTTFSYADLRILPSENDARCGVRVSVTVTNTGDVAGAEVVQLYVAKPQHEVFRPYQELRAFKKVTLQPGASCDVVLALDETAFRYWNVATNAWEIESGAYELRVGASSEDIRLVGTLELEGTHAPNPYEGQDLIPYETGRVAGGQVSDAHFEALLGHPIPADCRSIDENLRLCDLAHTRSPLLATAGALLEMAQDRSLAGASPDLRIAFAANMPLRAIAQMTGGLTDWGFVHALEREAKGWGLAGVVPFGVALWRGRRMRTAAFLWALWTMAPLAIAFVTDAAQNVAVKRRLMAADATR